MKSKQRGTASVMGSRFLSIQVACALVLICGVILLGRQALQIGSFKHQCPADSLDGILKGASNAGAGGMINVFVGDRNEALAEEPRFFDVAMKHWTDKVTTHMYHHMYQKYIGPIRTQPLKMLEIGLGCGMPWGVGASLYTWLEWLPNVEMYYLEYFGDCVEPFKKALPDVKFYVGDQADPVLLQRIVNETGGEFDIIIDDGGHQVQQQIASLDHLFPALKKGGVYFLEDLQPGYIENKTRTTLLHIQEILDDLVGARMHYRRFNISRDLFAIECQVDICAFTRLTDELRVPGWPGYLL